MSREVIAPAAQYAAVSRITDLNSYAALPGKLFKDGTSWRAHVAQRGERTAAFFRLVGLSDVLTAQYGFPHRVAQIYRHYRKDWQRNPLGLPHQLALITYMAGVNVEAYPIKLEVINSLPDSLANGVWGTHMPVEGGRMVGRGRLDPDTAQEWAERRIHEDPRPILLTDLALNSALAVIGFNGDDAERMPEDEVRRDILPEVVRRARVVFETDYSLQSADK